MLKFTLLLAFLLFGSQGFSQKFLLLDNYGKNRIKLYKGAKIQFTLKNNKVKYHDYIAVLKDSSLVLGATGQEVMLEDFKQFRFSREWVQFLNGGTTVIASGFLFAAAIEPAIVDARYDAKESAMIGTSFFFIGQFARLFSWKKFNIKKGKRRIRVIDTTFLK